MLLREYLQDYTKEELLEHARSFELKKCSKLRKAALIDRILEYFCSEEVLRSRLACLTKEQMALFRRACDMPQDVSKNELVDSIQLYRYWIGTFEESTDRFCVFKEIAGIFGRVDDDTFRKEQRKKG